MRRIKLFENTLLTVLPKLGSIDRVAIRKPALTKMSWE